MIDDDIVNSWVPRSGGGLRVSHLATGPYAITFGHLKSMHTGHARQTSQAVRLDETQSERLRPCSLSVDLSVLARSREYKLIRGEPWHIRPVRASPAPMGRPQPLNDDMFIKAYGRSRSANRSTVGTGRHQVLPAVPRGTAERRAGSDHKQFFCSVRYIAVANRAVCNVQVRRRHSGFTESGSLTVGISRPGDDLQWLTVMHRHTCICGPDTKRNISAESCASVLSIKLPVQASDMLSA
jgi:hypothetical protein